MLLIANTLPCQAPKQVERVEEAIRDGYQTLRAISDHTGIDYRSVNAQVTSLTKQRRVVVTNPHDKRREQIFQVPTGGQPRSNDDAPPKISTPASQRRGTKASPPQPANEAGSMFYRNSEGLQAYPSWLATLYVRPADESRA